MNYGELKLKMDAKAVSVPVPDPTNTGNGTISQPKASHAAPVETWTLICTTLGGAGVAVFSCTGSVSTAQTNVLTSDLAYTSDSGEVSFLITAGLTDWAIDDEIVFTVSDNVVGMNDDAEIREIEYRIHSKVDDVKVGYDAVKDQVRVIMVD